MKISLCFLEVHNMPRNETYRKNILKVLGEAKEPLGIETIKEKAGVKVWETAKAILLELVFESKIAGMKTGKSWVFGRPETMDHAMITRR